jgi:hypothetical protein
MRIPLSPLPKSTFGAYSTSAPRPLLHLAIYVGDLSSANFPHFGQIAIAARSIDLALREALPSIPTHESRRRLLRLSFVVEANEANSPWPLIAQRSFEESLNDTFFRSGEDSPIPMELRTITAESLSSFAVDILVLNFPNLCSSGELKENSSEASPAIFFAASTFVVAVDPIRHASGEESNAYDAHLLCRACLAPLVTHYGDSLVLVHSLSQLSTGMSSAANSLIEEMMAG